MESPKLFFLSNNSPNINTVNVDMTDSIHVDLHLYGNEKFHDPEHDYSI